LRCDRLGCKLPTKSIGIGPPYQNRGNFQAYVLIEEDRLVEAEALLKPILTDEPDNADAWWLYAHAVSDPEQARMALNSVLRIDPGYPGASELLSSLEQTYPGISQSPEPARKVAPPPSLPDDELLEAEEIREIGDFEYAESEPDFEQGDSLEPDVETHPGSVRQSRFLVPLLIIIAIAAVVLVLLSVLSRSDQAGEQSGVAETSTALAMQQAVPPTLDATMEAPDVVGEVGEVPTSAVSEETALVITDALSDYAVIPNGIGALETLLGNTLLVSVCGSIDSFTRSDEVNTIMYALADASALLDPDIQAIGARLINCNNNEILNVIAVPVSDASAFSEGSIDAKDYQAGWQPVL
jgi:hypothetical protein